MGRARIPKLLHPHAWSLSRDSWRLDSDGLLMALSLSPYSPRPLRFSYGLCTQSLQQVAEHLTWGPGICRAQKQKFPCLIVSAELAQCHFRFVVLG